MISPCTSPIKFFLLLLRITRLPFVKFPLLFPAADFNFFLFTWLFDLLLVPVKGPFSAKPLVSSILCSSLSFFSSSSAVCFILASLAIFSWLIFFCFIICFINKSLSFSCDLNSILSSAFLFNQIYIFIVNTLSNLCHCFKIFFEFFLSLFEVSCILSSLFLLLINLLLERVVLGVQYLAHVFIFDLIKTLQCWLESYQ